jgi:predicted nucleotidyltransferase component of viral defense system
MQNRNSYRSSVHEDGDFFREAILYTATLTGFTSELIEKDYFCSILLSYLYGDDTPLVFRGGTCLSKIYGEFYRLSEDLDFTISVPFDAPRSLRRKKIESVKKVVGRIYDTLSIFSLSQNLVAHNNSTQYIAQVKYQSHIRSSSATIKIEIGLREEILTMPQKGLVKTLLLDPFSYKPVVQEFSAMCLSLNEAYAEKIRAALTRRELAIRDFYDIDYAVRKMGIDLSEERLLDLVRKKLAVPENDPVNLDSSRKEMLKAQLNTELKPILREQDLQQFDLDRAFNLVAEIGLNMKQLR